MLYAKDVVCILIYIFMSTYVYLKDRERSKIADKEADNTDGLLHTEMSDSTRGVTDVRLFKRDYGTNNLSDGDGAIKDFWEMEEAEEDEDGTEDEKEATIYHWSRDEDEDEDELRSTDDPTSPTTELCPTDNDLTSPTTEAGLDEEEEEILVSTWSRRQLVCQPLLSSGTGQLFVDEKRSKKEESVVIIEDWLSRMDVLALLTHTLEVDVDSSRPPDDHPTPSATVTHHSSKYLKALGSFRKVTETISLIEMIGVVPTGNDVSCRTEVMQYRHPAEDRSLIPSFHGKATLALTLGPDRVLAALRKAWIKKSSRVSQLSRTTRRLFQNTVTSVQNKVTLMRKFGRKSTKEEPQDDAIFKRFFVKQNNNPSWKEL